MRESVEWWSFFVTHTADHSLFFLDGRGRGKRADLSAMVSAGARAAAAHACSSIFEFLGETRVPVVTLRLVETLLKQIEACTRDVSCLHWHVHVSGHDHRGQVFWMPIYEDTAMLTTSVRSVLSSVYHCVESPYSMVALSSAVLGMRQSGPHLSSGTRHGSFTSGLPGDGGTHRSAAGLPMTLAPRASGGTAGDTRLASGGASASNERPSTSNKQPSPSDEQPSGPSAGSLQSGPACGATRGSSALLPGGRRADGEGASGDPRPGDASAARGALDPLAAATPSSGPGLPPGESGGAAAHAVPPAPRGTAEQGERGPVEPPAPRGPDRQGGPAARTPPVGSPVSGDAAGVRNVAAELVDKASGGDDECQAESGVDEEITAVGTRSKRLGRRTQSSVQPTCPVSEHCPPVVTPSEATVAVVRTLLSADGRLSQLRTALSKASSAVCGKMYARRARVCLPWWPRPPGSLTVWPLSVRIDGGLLDLALTGRLSTPVPPEGTVLLPHLRWERKLPVPSRLAVLLVMIEKDPQARLAVQRLVASLPLPRGGKVAAAALGPRASAAAEQQAPPRQAPSAPSGQAFRALQLKDLTADRGSKRQAPTAGENASLQAAPAEPGETFANSPSRPANFVFKDSTPPTHYPSGIAPAPLPAPLPPTNPAAVAARAAHRQPSPGQSSGLSTAPALGSNFSAIDLRAALKSATEKRKKVSLGATTGPARASSSSVDRAKAAVVGVSSAVTSSARGGGLQSDQARPTMQTSGQSEPAVPTSQQAASTTEAAGASSPIEAAAQGLQPAATVASGGGPDGTEVRAGAAESPGKVSLVLRNGGAPRPALSVVSSGLPPLPPALTRKGGTPRQDARTGPVQGAAAISRAGESAESRSAVQSSGLVASVPAPDHKPEDVPSRPPAVLRPSGEGPSSPVISLAKPPPVRTPPFSSSRKQQGPTPQRSGGTGAEVSPGAKGPVAPIFSGGLRPPPRRTTAYSPAKKAQVVSKAAQSALGGAQAADDTPSVPATAPKPRRRTLPATRPRPPPASRPPAAPLPTLQNPARTVLSEAADKPGAAAVVEPSAVSMAAAVPSPPSGMGDPNCQPKPPAPPPKLAASSTTPVPKLAAPPTTLVPKMAAPPTTPVPQLAAPPTTPVPNLAAPPNTLGPSSTREESARLTTTTDVEVADEAASTRDAAPQVPRGGPEVCLTRSSTLRPRLPQDVPKPLVTPRRKLGIRQQAAAAVLLRAREQNESGAGSVNRGDAQGSSLATARQPAPVLALSRRSWVGGSRQLAAVAALQRDSSDVVDATGGTSRLPAVPPQGDDDEAACEAIAAPAYVSGVGAVVPPMPDDGPVRKSNLKRKAVGSSSAPRRSVRFTLPVSRSAPAEEGGEGSPSPKRSKRLAEKAASSPSVLP